MQREISGICAGFGLILIALSPGRADELTPYSQPDRFIVVGEIQSVNGAADRLVVNGNDAHRYVIDAYGADVTLLDSRLGEIDNLARGMRVRVVGSLLGRNLLEADRLRVLPAFAGAGFQTVALPAEAPPPIEERGPVYNPPPVDAAPLPLPAPIVAVSAEPQFILDGMVRDVDAAHGQITLLGDDDKRYTADMSNTDIILIGTEREGLLSDLAHGMRVHLVGFQTASGVIEADRLRVLPAPAAPAPVIAPVVPVVENMDAYTGILIDARGLPTISRSPAPAIYGTTQDSLLLYPDRSHVPTPDEVQEESIVRYYWTIPDADAGVGGNNPLILTAQAVLGPAQDAVQLTPLDEARFRALDKRLHFTRTWKVGFLMPADH